MSDKAIKQDGLSVMKNEEVNKTTEEDKNNNSGANSQAMIEPCPQYLMTGNEKGTINGNARIVLGKDRPAGPESGHGGSGETHCSTISMVVGAMGINAADVDSEGKKLYVNSNNRTDAATFYLSQTTDVDKNFGLADGWNGKSSTKSAAVLKADDVRLVSRQGIKLVTGPDPRNSRDKTVEGTYGIDLIAGNNDEDIQSMVKGANLIEALRELKVLIGDLNGTFTGFLQYQMKFNIATLLHFHITTLPGLPTSPDLNVLPGQAAPELANMVSRTYTSLISNTYNLEMADQNYLQPYGKKYICSAHHHLT